MENFKYEIGKSDVLKVFVGGVLYIAVLMMAKVYFQMNGETESWFVGKTFEWITIGPKAIFRPWTWLTHALTELDVWGFLSNFLWLYFFGFIIEDLRGRYSVISLLLVTTLTTGLLAAILAKVAPQTFNYPFYYGMRVAVLSVASAAVFFSPTYRVFQQIFPSGIPIWVIGVLFLALSMSTGRGDVVTVICMLIAIGFGYAYNTFLKGFFMTVQNILRGTHELGRPKQMKVVVNNVKEKPVQIINVEQNKIDKILDKISEKGVESLTEQERNWLDAYSKKD
jgi:membrane associated rhomboid family serine protease